jgi:glycosyltransferase involved in cell wall biosynthesis
MKNRIIFLSPSLRKGGAENQLVKLAIFLAKKDFKIKVLTFIEGNDFDEILKENKIQLQVFSLKKNTGVFSFLKFIKNNKPNLIIAFMFSANIVSRFVKVLFKIPIITSVRANDMSPLYRFLYKLTYKIDDVSTFNSDFSYHHFTTTGLAKKESSTVINNGIEFEENFLKTDFEFNNLIKLISIAHFRPSKDYKTLFKAIKILKDRNYKIKLEALGTIDNLKWPYEMLKELDIENEVDIVGFTYHTKKHLDNSDIFVLSSYLEGTPNALLEAMSRKIPVIASNIPGNDFVIKESNGGLLFELENELMLADSIIKIIEMEVSKRALLANNGFEFVLKNHELNNVLNKWDSIILKTINNER